MLFWCADALRWYPQWHCSWGEHAWDTYDSGFRPEISCSHIFGIYIIYNYIQLYIYTYYTYILYHIIQYYVTLYIHVIVHTFDCIYIWLYIHMIVYSRMILCRLLCRFLARILERPSIAHAQISMWPWWMMGSSWTCRTLHRQKLGVAIWPQNCVSRSLTVLALSFEGTTVSGWLRLNFFVLKVCNSTPNMECLIVGSMWTELVYKMVPSYCCKGAFVDLCDIFIVWFTVCRHSVCRSSIGMYRFIYYEKCTRASKASRAQSSW